MPRPLRRGRVLPRLLRRLLRQLLLVLRLRRPRPARGEAGQRGEDATYRRSAYVCCTPCRTSRSFMTVPASRSLLIPYLASPEHTRTMEMPSIMESIVDSQKLSSMYIYNTQTEMERKKRANIQQSRVWTGKQAREGAQAGNHSGKRGGSSFVADGRARRARAEQAGRGRTQEQGSFRRRRHERRVRCMASSASAHQPEGEKAAYVATSPTKTQEAAGHAAGAVAASRRPGRARGGASGATGAR
jgi:hypothetical protein